MPVEGTVGPSTGAEIVDGAFTIPNVKGPVLGRHRVEIEARRKTGRVVDAGGLAGQMEESEQYIPEQYNSGSTLVVDITSGANTLDFDLESGASP